MSVETYYNVLGIPEMATQTQIKAAYRGLIKQVHPDILSNLPPYLRRLAEDEAKDITQAYSVLSDVSKRHQYDRLLADHRRQTAPTPSPPPQQSAPQRPFGPYCTNCGMALIVFAPGGARPATLLCPKCGDINWKHFKRWVYDNSWYYFNGRVSRHIVLVLIIALTGFFFLVSLLPDPSAPTQSQTSSATATQRSPAVSTVIFSAYPCDRTESVSPIDHKPCIPNATAPSNSSDKWVVTALEDKPSVKHALAHVVAPRNLETADLAACIKSGACKAVDPVLFKNKTSKAFYAVVKSNYARLEKRCAFIPAGNPRHCSFDHTIAELRQGDRVRVVSSPARAEDGNDIYRIRTQQGWVGWVNSTVIVVEH